MLCSTLVNYRDMICQKCGSWCIYQSVFEYVFESLVYLSFFKKQKEILSDSYNFYLVQIEEGANQFD